MSQVLTSSGVPIVLDAADVDVVRAAGPWHLRRHGLTAYAQRHIWRDGVRTTQQLHNFLLGVLGVDHVNGDGLDNRRANLRPAGQRLNSANQRRRTNNTTGFKGVSRKRNGTRFIAQIRVEGKNVHLGTFNTAEEAARAYDAAAHEAWGPFARLNFPKNTNDEEDNK